MPITLKLLLSYLEALLIIKVAVYHFLMSLLVPEFLRLKDLKTIEKMVQGTAWSWLKSIKIKICDAM